VALRRAAGALDRALAAMVGWVLALDRALAAMVGWVLALDQALVAVGWGPASGLVPARSPVRALVLARVRG
jgi:hypothetical protein